MKILIELPTWLGDTIMATPAINNLLTFYEHPELTLIGSKVSIEILKNYPGIKRTELIEKKYKSIYNLSKKLERFEAYFSFRSSFRSKLMRILISSNNKFQFNNGKYPVDT